MSLHELIQHIEGYENPSRLLLTRLKAGGDLLRQYSVFVENVGSRIREYFVSKWKLAEPLDRLSGSVRRARDAIDDFRDTLQGELIQREAESKHHNYRPNKRFRQDQQEIRTLRRTAEDSLRELNKHINRLRESLLAAGD